MFEVKLELSPKTNKQIRSLSSLRQKYAYICGDKINRARTRQQPKL